MGGWELSLTAFVIFVSVKKEDRKFWELFFHTKKVLTSSKCYRKKDAEKGVNTDYSEKTNNCERIESKVFFVKKT